MTGILVEDRAREPDLPTKPMLSIVVMVGFEHIVSLQTASFRLELTSS